MLKAESKKLRFSFAIPKTFAIFAVLQQLVELFFQPRPDKRLFVQIRIWAFFMPIGLLPT
ncbi:hypothetical protein DW800_05195 [Bacteroides sp. AM32-11AC]|jgi:hypothetical protein|nr:hypothetical protein DW800_05195 [Bacteroides sp. AM32-11AC]